MKKYHSLFYYECQKYFNENISEITDAEFDELKKIKFLHLKLPNVYQSKI